MAKKKSSTKKSGNKFQGNILYVIIGLVLAALVVSTLAFNVFHKNDLFLDTHTYVSGVQYIGNLFAGDGKGYTEFMDIAGVICYMLTVLGSFACIVLTILRVCGVKISSTAIKLVACFTALFALVFTVFAFISATNQTKVFVVGGKETGYKVSTHFAVYIALFASIGNAVVSLLDKK